MTQPNYVFETDPRVGLPRLRLAAGPSLGWSVRDMEQVEAQLLSRYETLALTGAGSLTHKGRTIHVRRKADDRSRQPTLELHTPEPPVPRSGDANLPVELSAPPATPTRDWFSDWLGGLDKTVACDGQLDEAERAMTRVVLKELLDLGQAKPPEELAVLLFGAVVSLADRLSQAHLPGKPSK